MTQPTPETSGSPAGHRGAGAVADEQPTVRLDRRTPTPPGRCRSADLLTSD